MRKRQFFLFCVVFVALFRKFYYNNSYGGKISRLCKGVFFYALQNLFRYAGG